MISVNDFRTGLTIEVDNGLWQVLDFQHVKPGKGAAFVRSKLRNLRNGNIQEKTFRAGEKVSRAHIEHKKCSTFILLVIRILSWIMSLSSSWSFKQRRSNTNLNS